MAVGQDDSAKSAGRTDKLAELHRTATHRSIPSHLTFRMSREATGTANGEQTGKGDGETKRRRR